MSRLPDNLPDILRKHGLHVQEIPGWQTRGRPPSTGTFSAVGVLCHDTVTGPATSDAEVIKLLVDGRSDLPGPLVQLGLNRQGLVYVIAAGRSNHAGMAKPFGTMAGGDGNSIYVGIEAFNSGTGEKWPQAQWDAYVLLAAVLCVEVTHNSVHTVAGHKETSLEGKIDPSGPTPFDANFNMDRFRTQVAATMKKLNAPPAPKKPVDPLVLLGYNCYVASDSSLLVKQIDAWWHEHGLHGGLLSEARTHYGPLQAYAKKAGLQIFQRQPSNTVPKGVDVNDQGDSAILLSKDLKVTHHRVAQMHEKWVVVGHNKVHTPREYETLGVDFNGTGVALQAPHWPTHGFKGANAKAFLESATRGRAWLTAGQGPRLDIGDLNETESNIAAFFGKGYTIAGSGIDLAVARNVRSVQHAELEKGPSDHHGQLYTVHL